MQFRNLRNLLEDFLAIGIPGVDLAVYHHHKPVFRHMAGFADLEERRPITEETVFQAFSVTKLLTCTAVMQLYEQGKFLLDDPVSTYLPEFACMQVKEQDGTVHPAKKQMEIWHLLSMSAGIGFGPSRETVAAVAARTDGRVPTRELIRDFAKEPLLYEPGEGWLYGYCHDVLGAMVEAITGETLYAYCSKHIMEPLGLTDLYFTVPEDRKKDLAAMYLYEKESRSVKRTNAEILPVQLGPAYESGGAGLYCTVSDYARFAEGLCSGELLAPCTLNLMRTNVLAAHQLDLFRASREPGIRVASERKGYGYGLGLRTMMDPVAGGSNGSIGECGWGGAAGAYVLLDPEKELTVFYAQQTMFPPAEYTRSRLRNAVYACIG